jgi:hypothetical protein
MKYLAVPLLLLILCSSPAFASKPPVLVIESYHAGNAWDRAYLGGFRGELGPAYRVESFEMDTKRLPKSLYPKQADLAWKRYLELGPQLVVLGDDNALKLLGPRFLETDTPVVYLGINNNPDDYVPAGRNITGILERPLFHFNLYTIGQILHPKPKKVLILFDQSTTSDASVAEAFKGKDRLAIEGIEVDLRRIGQWKAWQQTVNQAGKMGFDAAVIGLYHTLVDESGHNVPADEVLAWTARNCPLPFFGFWDFSIGAGKAIGGFVLSGEEQGKAAARMAKNVLTGTPPARIKPMTAQKGTFIFSKSQLQKYGLTLPPEMSSRTKWLK